MNLRSPYGVCASTANDIMSSTASGRWVDAAASDNMHDSMGSLEPATPFEAGVEPNEGDSRPGTSRSPPMKEESCGR